MLLIPIGSITSLNTYRIRTRDCQIDIGFECTLDIRSVSHQKSNL